MYNDAQGRGFVVVAGDDAMGEVLAYGTEGALDTLSANPCVRVLLDGYRQTFEVLREAAVPAQKVRRAAQYTKNRVATSEKQMGTIPPVQCHDWLSL
ncbi:MAG: Spi family protease inhibitor [Prevotella sp.]|nr:Spi family protease inhibitor [Prevotella sp.]